ncbi:hypothetical protein [Nesterenkonia sp. K-15-9-6]|uniref:hypothetical protein n=1 Tax=Nesterenkonia sp. K-15-9-6 TaxID=3093918 RepID=UPI004043AC70
MDTIERQCEYGDGRPTRAVGVWLCEVCLSQLDDYRSEGDEMLPVLRLIARGVEKPFSLPGRKQSGKPVSQAPMNLTAWALLEDIERFAPAAVVGADPLAGEIKLGMETTLRQAHAMVHGEAENRPTDDYISYRLSQIQPMTAQQAEVWFPLHLDIQLKARQVYNWRDRGRLYPVDGTRPPRYRAIDIFKAWENRRSQSFMADTPGAQKRRDILFSTSSR